MCNQALCNKITLIFLLIYLVIELPIIGAAYKQAVANKSHMFKTVRVNAWFLIAFYTLCVHCTPILFK